MLLPPIVEREMRAAIRAPKVLRTRWWTAFWAAVVAAFCLLLSLAVGPTVWGWFLKYTLVFAIYLAVVRPAQHAAGLFAEERRNQTLGLIYLTGISSFELFVTKFCGGLLVASNELLALVPFIAFPFLSGGVTLDLFLATCGTLPTLLFFTMTLTVLVSVLCTDESQALAWIGGMIAITSLATPLAYSLGVMVAGTPPFHDRWLYLSPAYAPYLVFSGFGVTGSKPFWAATAVTWLWSLLFLAAAAWSFPRTWRDDPDTGTLAILKRKYAALIRRCPNARRLRRILDQNPFQWQVELNRRSISAAWLAFFVIIAFWLFGWAAWKEQWFSPVCLYASSFLLAMVVDLFQMYAPARDIALHRRDEMFEVILTTPLGPAQIVEGEIQASKAQFSLLRKTLCTVFAAMMIGGLFARPFTGHGLITYFVIWGLLIVWAGTHRRLQLTTMMWVAINTGRSGYALRRAHGSGWGWIFNIYNLRNMFASLASGKSRFPTGSEAELIGVCVGSAFVVVLLIVVSIVKNPPELYGKLIDEMRSIVQDPVPSPKDPRLRKWDYRKKRFNS